MKKMRRIFALMLILCMGFLMIGGEAKADTTVSGGAIVIPTPTPTPLRKPVVSSVPKQIVNTKDKKYTYSDYMTDVKMLGKYFPKIFRYRVIGTSYDKRNIYGIIIGNPKAKRQVVVIGNLHAREWLNVQFLMEKAEYFCRYYNQAKYKGKLLSKLLGDTCLMMVPMSNPDGTNISQYGANGIHNKTLRNKIKKMRRNGGYSAWKANARGVDLNRNFSKGWGKGNSRFVKRCGSEGYRGKSPMSEKESKAVASFTWTAKNPKIILSYHSTGSILYRNYWASKKMQNKINGYAKKISKLTGYRNLYWGMSKTGNGGFGEWSVYKRKVPSVTIETGTVRCPLPFSQLAKIRSKNKYVLEEMLYSK